ncbi:hypothetical protein LCGC14_0383230 [marine sediment metagenome]|uniref:Uncharacterized protein n=1 Tax=marine sediment metagenome TaxID=412755 RepID=A0A0F9T7J6_9ZZZZ
MAEQKEAPKQAPTLDQIKAEMLQAITDGNDADVARLAKSIQKHSTDIVKAEADKQKKEGEALAGVREKLAVAIHTAIGDISSQRPERVAKGVEVLAGIEDKLSKVKAKGYTFKLDELDVQYKSVALAVPTVRKSSGGGGGGTGVTVQSQTGLRRGELIEKFGTGEEKANIQKAFDGASSSPGSAKWSAEKPVVKRILADHPELIKR